MRIHVRSTLYFRYTACFFICPLPNQVDPLVVSLLMLNLSASPVQPLISMNNTPADLPLLPVIVPLNISVEKRKFSICVPPFHDYLNFKELIEWIELTMLLGAEHFTFYNLSMCKRTDQVLSYYSKRGLVEVLPWKMPKELLKNIHYYGQLAAINDCLYRNRNLTKYLAFNDLDEYIIPREQNITKWADMLARLKNGNSFSFRSTFFWKKWAAKPNTSIGEHTDNLLTMSAMKHANYSFANGKRSKLIIRPENVEIMNIHHVGKMVNGTEKTTNGVDVNIGLLHHYRNGFVGDTPIEDNTMLKYRTALIERVKTFWNNFDNA